MSSQYTTTVYCTVYCTIQYCVYSTGNRTVWRVRTVQYARVGDPQSAQLSSTDEFENVLVHPFELLSSSKIFSSSRERLCCVAALQCCGPLSNVRKSCSCSFLSLSLPLILPIYFRRMPIQSALSIELKCVPCPLVVPSPVGRQSSKSGRTGIHLTIPDCWHPRNSFLLHCRAQLFTAFFVYSVLTVFYLLPHSASFWLGNTNTYKLLC